MRVTHVSFQVLRTPGPMIGTDFYPKKFMTVVRKRLFTGDRKGAIGCSE